MITFLIKGLIRDRSRSLFPILMVGAGAFLTVMLYSYMKGAIGDMVDSSARFDAGHVKIMTRAYSELSDQMPNDLALLGTADLMDQLRKDHPHMIWTPRIKFGGLIDIPDEDGRTRSQGPAFGMGIDLNSPDAPEIDILNLRKSVVKGRLPQNRNEILMSESFAEKLGLNIGEKATLISSTMNGGMTVHNFKVVGTVRFGMVVLDKSTIIADIHDVREALDMTDAAGEIVGFAKDMVYADSAMELAAQKFNEKYIKLSDEFSPMMLSLSGQGGLINEMLKMADTIGGIAVLVFVFVMSVVLWNAGLMNGIRRYGEIGVRLAMGEPKGNIYRSMVFESICIGITGSVLGTAIGLVVSYWMQYTGLDFSGMMQKSTIYISSVMHARVTMTSYYIGFLPGLFASVLGTMFAGVVIYKRETSQLFKELEI
ncbi:ABC transporter permease [Thermodesulfobacteriota bacterium]